MRSTSTAAFVRSTLLALALGALFLLTLTISNLYLVVKTQEYSASAMMAGEVRSAAGDLLRTIQKAESGQRGYLLAQDSSFLDPYQHALAELPEMSATLRMALEVADLPDVDVAGLADNIDKKLAEMTQTLNYTKSGHLAEAVALVRNSYGLELMQDIDAKLTEIIRRSEVHMAETIEDQDSMAKLLEFVTIVGIAALIAVMGAAATIISRFVKELLVARQDLRKANDGLEERVRERTDELIQANKEIQRYAYIVTHDLRAPLVNIMGFTSELNTSLDTIRGFLDVIPEDHGRREDLRLAVEEDLPEAISFIRSSTSKMDGLINAILKLSREGRRNLKPEKIDLEALVNTIADTVQHQLAEAGGSFATQIEIPAIISDRLSLEQIFGNLFDNAIKYSHPDRPLVVQIRAFAVARQSIAIEFSDNGRGIAPEDHERIFDLFRRSGKQDKPGEGIGLAYLRSLTRNMGGDIQVRSELGSGSTFVIRLPKDLSNFVKSNQ